MIELRSPELAAAVVPHGARLARLTAPDRDGRPGQVVVGLAEPDYKADTAYLGATVGRYANRIAGGEFVLDGRRYVLPRNEPGATLHGGPAGFDHADFAAGPATAVPGGQTVTLRHTSPAGDGGFPGTLSVTVTYTVRGPELAITITATTDAPTVVNLTNHAYFDLGGRGTIADHEITVLGDLYLPVDADLIPAGGPDPVTGTPFDLRVPTRIGDRLADPALATTGGFDHCFVVRGTGLRPAAIVRDPGSGRTLTVLSDQPGLQFYSGNRIDTITHDGRRVRRHGAFCLEPQQFPDAPNRPDFPATVLRPGEEHTTRIVLRFGTDSTERP
ncbi:aldose epimerase family protein [Pseudonocardia sp. CA-107938]|uniref:aldose epimerase family protein n=1 Tax=Pseudonocardia sp. CA-107938 TaxID=3240021 RepID=UPI003D945926